MQESFDPKNPEYEFYGKRDETLLRYKQKLKEREEDNKKHSKRRLRILFFDIIIICLMAIFFVAVRPKVLATENFCGYKFTISCLPSKEESGVVAVLLQARLLEEEANRELQFEISYGEQKESFTMKLPEAVGGISVKDFLFNKEEGDPKVECRLISKDKEAQISAFSKRFSLF